MPRGVYKKPENRTAREEIASVIAWARAAGFRRCSGDPRIAPRTDPRHRACPDPMGRPAQLSRHCRRLRERGLAL